MLTILRYTGRGIVILLGYALAMQVFFSVNVVDDFGTFMIETACLAGLAGLGFLIVGLSPKKDAVRKRYAMLAPWAPLGIVYFILLVWNWSVWLGLTMLLPILMGFASLGGRYARRWVISRKWRLSRTNRGG
jgi:hypothetical protein